MTEEGKGEEIRLRPEDRILLANLERVCEASGKKLLTVLVCERGPAAAPGGSARPVIVHLYPEGIAEGTVMAAMAGTMAGALGQQVVPINVGAIMAKMAQQYGSASPAPPMPEKKSGLVIAP